MNPHFPYGLRLEPIQARSSHHSNNIAPSMSCSEVDAHRFLCHNSDFLVLATGIRPGTGALRPVTWAQRRSSSFARPFSIFARLVRLPPLGPNRSQRQGNQPQPTEGLDRRRTGPRPVVRFLPASRTPFNDEQVQRVLLCPRAPDQERSLSIR